LATERRGRRRFTPRVCAGSRHPAGGKTGAPPAKTVAAGRLARESLPQYGPAGDLSTAKPFQLRAFLAQCAREFFLFAR
jgi:hypothetical protein